MSVIEITHENSLFFVNLKINQQKKIIGYQLNTFREAIKLAEVYQRLGFAISIKVLPSEMK